MLVVVAAVWVGFGDRIARVQVVSTLFTGAEQSTNFNRMHSMFPIKTMPASSQPKSFELGEQIELPSNFAFSGEVVETTEFLARTDTAAPANS